MKSRLKKIGRQCTAGTAESNTKITHWQHTDTDDSWDEETGGKLTTEANWAISESIDQSLLYQRYWPFWISWMFQLMYISKHLIRDLDAFTLWSHFTFSTPAFQAFLLLIYTIHMQRSNFHNSKTYFGSRTLEQMERSRRYSGFYCLSSNHDRYALDFQYKTIKKSQIRLTPSSDWRLGIKRF